MTSRSDAPGGSAPAPQLSADFFDFQQLLSVTEQRALAELRDFFDTEIRPFADDYWERAEPPTHLLKRAADMGMFRHAFPEYTPFPNSAVFRGWVAMELASADPSTATLIGVHSGLAMGAISVGGSAEQRAEWMPKLVTGEQIGAFGLTEPNHGSDTARGLETTAERRGDTWVLNGAKRWIGNAVFADFVVIWARDLSDQHVKGFIVRTPTTGFTATKIERKYSMRAVENADIVLDNVIVPEHDRLQNVSGFREVAEVLKHARAGVGWQAVGVSIAAYEAARAYAAQREQFGKPIASFQLVQVKLAECLAHISASLALCVRAAQLQDAGTQADEHAAMVKAFTTARMRETVAMCRDICGGNGIQLDYGVARYFADAETVYTFDGTYDMNSLVVGRAITGIAAFV